MVKTATQPVNPAPRPARNWLKPALLALCATFLIGLFSTEISDYDFWWTLKSGQYIAQFHRLPVPDPFAYTTALAHDAYAGESITRRFNLTFEWLAQLKFYAVYQIAGFGGIVLFRAFMLTVSCALIGLIVWKRTGSLFRSLAAAFAVAAVFYPNFAHDRSYLFTFAFLAATLALLEYRRWLWALPPLFLIWANCHGGFFLGWIAVAAYSAEAFYLARSRRDKPGDKPDAEPDRHLWIVSAVAIVASAINPNGFRVIQVLGYFRHSFLQSKLLEWAAPSLWPPTPFSVLLIAGAGVLVWKRKQVRLVDWVLFILFAAASLTAQRNVFMIGYWAPVAIASYAPIGEQFAAALWMFAALVCGVASGGNFFQLRVADWRFPVGAANFLRAHRVSTPMFNTYEFGGYLMWRLWPQERVFIDGRALSESVFNDYARILYNHSNADGGKSSSELLNQYGIDTIVMNGFEYSGGLTYNLLPALSGNTTDWHLVYNDPQAVIFMRNPPPGVTPLDSAQALGHLEAECQLHLDNEPQYPLCARAVAQVFEVLGQVDKERLWLYIYLHRPHDPDPDAERVYQSIKAAK